MEVSQWGQPIGIEVEESVPPTPRRWEGRSKPTPLLSFAESQNQEHFLFCRCVPEMQECRDAGQRARHGENVVSSPRNFYVCEILHFCIIFHFAFFCDFFPNFLHFWGGRSSPFLLVCDITLSLVACRNTRPLA